MTREIPAEAIEKYRRLELRATTANAAAQALRERVERYRGEEGDLRISLRDFLGKPTAGERIEFTDDGSVLYHREGGRDEVLAESHATVVRLCKLRATLADAIQRRDAAAAEAQPINGLRSQCAEHLKSLGWEDI